MKKILIIEDEPNIIELVGYNLNKNGFDYISAEDGVMGITLAHKEKPDLILLDLMLPLKNGLDICKELREEGNKTPIIMLTAKSDEIEKILGLEFGADDYITKPFSVHELMARVKAVLRRYENAVENSKERSSNHIQIGTLSVDKEKYEARIGEIPLDLTLKEFELLFELAENKGNVLTREELMNNVWGVDFIGESRTVDVHIRHLRRKIYSAGGKDIDIETIRGKGYKMK